jgi:hypothetical protein
MQRSIVTLLLLLTIGGAAPALAGERRPVVAKRTDKKQ